MLKTANASQKRPSVWADVPIYYAVLMLLAVETCLAFELNRRSHEEVPVGNVLVNAIPFQIALCGLLLGHLSLLSEWVALGPFPLRIRIALLMIAVGALRAFDWLDNEKMGYLTEFPFLYGGVSTLGCFTIAAALRWVGYRVRKRSEADRESAFHLRLVDIVWWTGITATAACAWKYQAGDTLWPPEHWKLQHVLPLGLQWWICLRFGLGRSSTLAATFDVFFTALALSLSAKWLIDGSDGFDRVIIGSWAANASLTLGARAAGYRVYRSQPAIGLNLNTAVEPAASVVS